MKTSFLHKDLRLKRSWHCRWWWQRHVFLWHRQRLLAETQTKLTHQPPASRIWELKKWCPAGSFPWWESKTQGLWLIPGTREWRLRAILGLDLINLFLSIDIRRALLFGTSWDILCILCFLLSSFFTFLYLAKSWSFLVCSADGQVSVISLANMFWNSKPPSSPSCKALSAAWEANKEKYKEASLGQLTPFILLATWAGLFQLLSVFAKVLKLVPDLCLCVKCSPRGESHKVIRFYSAKFANVCKHWCMSRVTSGVIAAVMVTEIVRN